MSALPPNSGHWDSADARSIVWNRSARRYHFGQHRRGENVDQPTLRQDRWIVEVLQRRLKWRLPRPNLKRRFFQHLFASGHARMIHMFSIPRRYSHFIFAVIQAGLTCLIAAGIASLPVMTITQFITHWLLSWVISWVTMLPVVMLAAPTIRFVSFRLTSSE